MDYGITVGDIPKIQVASLTYKEGNTVSVVIKLAETNVLAWQIPEALANADIEQMFYLDCGNNEERKYLRPHQEIR